MSEKKSILLIDDEQDLAELVAFQFKARGFRVETAQDGLEGLERLKILSPDLIILDVNMPRMGGLEFFQNVCDERGKPRFPVFFLTARANIEHVFEGFKIEGFMTKPFEIDQLIAVIDDVLRKKKSARTVDDG